MNNSASGSRTSALTEQFSGLLTDNRLYRPHGQERQGDSCAEDCHDVELRAKSTAGEHGLGGGRQHFAQDSDQRGRPVHDPNQEIVEESVEEGLGERAYKTGSPDTGEHASDRVGQGSNRALDRSQDPGEASAATRVLCCRRRRETTGGTQRRQLVKSLSGSHDRSGTRSSRGSERPRSRGRQRRRQAPPFGRCTRIGSCSCRSERPGRGAKHEADERRDERPPTQAVGQLLDRGLARQGRGARGHRDDAGKQESGRQDGHRPTFQDGGLLGRAFGELYASVRLRVSKDSSHALPRDLPHETRARAGVEGGCAFGSPACNAGGSEQGLTRDGS